MNEEGTTEQTLLRGCMDAEECLVMVNNHTCQSTDNVNKLERALFIYLYPFIAAICVIGNTANLVVYNHSYLRSSTTIRMLAVKAVANTFNIISLLPMHVSSLALLSPASHDIPPPFYWLSLRYVLFFANVFSTIAIWLTAAVSIENCLLVVFPVHAKLWCTMRNACVAIGLCSICALLLHAFNLICREVTPIWCFDAVASNISDTYAFQIADAYAHLEGVYYWCSGVSTICLPMVIMAAATVLINYHLIWTKSEISRGAEQKRCVVRLSFVTALCHVVFEMPHLAVLVIAAKSGSAQEADDGWTAGTQTLSTVSNFLAQINASVPFVVYFLCSRRFRQLCMITIGGMPAVDVLSTIPFSRASVSQRRSEVVVLNSSRMSVSHLPLSTFNDAPPGDTSRRNTATLAPPSCGVDNCRRWSHGQEQENEPNHSPSSANVTKPDHLAVRCCESTGLLLRNE